MERSSEDEDSCRYKERRKSSLNISEIESSNDSSDVTRFLDMEKKTERSSSKYKDNCRYKEHRKSSLNISESSNDSSDLTGLSNLSSCNPIAGTSSGITHSSKLSYNDIRSKQVQIKYASRQSISSDADTDYDDNYLKILYNKKKQKNFI